MAKIAEINDRFRSSLGATPIPGKIVVTSGIAALSLEDQSTILKKVREFDMFTEDNDPFGEHDFGAFEHNGQRIFWKIDLYDQDLKFGSQAPADLAKTVRILTVLLASEW